VVIKTWERQSLRYGMKEGGQDVGWVGGGEEEVDKKENLLEPMRPTTRRSGYFFFENQRLA
jgi:hypothetical protein